VVSCPRGLKDGLRHALPKIFVSKANCFVTTLQNMRIIEDVGCHKEEQCLHFASLSIASVYKYFLTHASHHAFAI